MADSDSTQLGDANLAAPHSHCWLTALERLVVATGPTEMEALLSRKEEWIEAYQHTFHGSRSS
jgi:hypothetical protein